MDNENKTNYKLDNTIQIIKSILKERNDKEPEAYQRILKLEEKRKINERK